MGKIRAEIKDFYAINYFKHLDIVISGNTRKWVFEMLVLDKNFSLSGKQFYILWGADLLCYSRYVDMDTSIRNYYINSEFRFRSHMFHIKKQQKRIADAIKGSTDLLA